MRLDEFKQDHERWRLSETGKPEHWWERGKLREAELSELNYIRDRFNPMAIKALRDNHSFYWLNEFAHIHSCQIPPYWDVEVDKLLG